MALVSALLSLGFNPYDARHLGFDFVIGITAAGTTQAAGTVITGNVNHVDTVTSSNNAVTLPLAITAANGIVFIRNNDDLDTLQVFPGAGDTIDNLGANNPRLLLPGDSTILFRISTTQWVSSNSLGLTITSWTPTYAASGSMTYTSVTTSNAEFFQIGKIVFFYLRAVGTTGGTASGYIYATFPVTLAGGGCYATKITDVGGTTEIAGLSENINTTQFKVGRYDAAVWSLGASRTICVSGFYKAA